MDEIKTKRRPSWGIYLLLSLLVASVVAIVFGNMSVQLINDELYMTELLERQQYIPFYKWFNGSIEVENPRLDEPINELNNHTLREVFEGGNLVVNGDFSDGTYDWATDAGNNILTFYENGSNSMVVVNSTGHDYFNINQNITINANDEYYLSLNVYNNVGNNMELQVYSIPYDLHLKTTLLFNGLFNHYSTVFTKSIDNASITVFTSIDTLRTQSGSVSFKNIKLINKNSLGISALTVKQMDYWISVYQQLKNYTDIPIYDASAYGVTPEQIQYYYDKYLNYVETMELQDVYLVYTNPEYNTQIGTTFVVQYQNVTKSVLDTIDNLKGVYDGFKNTLDKIGDFFS